MKLTRGGELQYGGAKFATASRAFQQLLREASPRERYTRALLDQRGLWAVIDLLIRLPRLEVNLTDTNAGRTIQRYLQERTMGLAPNRIAQGVLSLPNSGTEYLSGRSRQALRTNIRRARHEGISCICARDVALRERLLETWIRTGTSGGDPTAALSKWLAAAPAHADWWIATDSNQSPLAVGVIVVDREWALLHDLVARSHVARWMLHTDIVVSAIETGVRYITVREGNALLLDSGTQYFQRLLGYQVANLRRPRMHRPHPRLAPAGDRSHVVPSDSQ